MQPKGTHSTFGASRTIHNKNLQRLKATARSNSNQCIPSWTAKRILSRMTKYSTQANGKIDSGDQDSTSKLCVGRCLPSSKSILASAAATTTSDVFTKPLAAPLLSVRSRCVSVADNSNLKKSQSYQNLKCVSVRSGFTGKHVCPASSNGISRPKVANSSIEHVSEAAKNLHGSVTCLPQTGKKIVDNSFTASESQFPLLLSAYDGQTSSSNAHRISINSDLLSRVEKEKKQYETRISKLTQITETRKMEIEKLTFEVRRAKEEAAKAAVLAEEAVKETEALRIQLCNLGAQPSQTSKEACSEGTVTPTDLPIPGIQETKATVSPRSPSESLGTTTRLTAGAATTLLTPGTITASSVCSDLNEASVPSLDIYTNTSVLSGHSPCAAGSETFATSGLLKPDLIMADHVKHDYCESTLEEPTVASLKGRILQMEEANCTTNEELQATLQELWDLQKSVDEAHEETHSLTFERAILLEALSTQTTKLEHCRFQIEQLKYLLLTDRSVKTPGTRENYFHNLYSSVEEEKQVLLGQNNDLAQSSESLARECRVLTEKAAQLQDNFDVLEAEHASLKTVYHSTLVELNSLKSKTEPEEFDGRKKRDAIVDVKPREHGESSEAVDITKSSQYTPGLQQNMPDINQQQLLTGLTQELNELQERFELLQSEHDRECTEWRLYERDLLKAVRVAETFRSEWETKASKLEVENQSLKRQVTTLKEASATLNNEVTTFNEKPSTTTTTNLTTVGFPNALVGPAASALVTPPMSPPRHSGNEMKVYSTTGSPQSQSPASTSTVAVGNTEVAICKAPNTSVVSVLNAVTYSAHPRCSTNFSHLHHHPPSSYSNSPGAPGRSFGPTVRSLIQSIENQVKAVQHQQRGITSKQSAANNQLSQPTAAISQPPPPPSSTSSPLRNALRTPGSQAAGSPEATSQPMTTMTSASAVSPLVVGWAKPRSARLTVTMETGASRLPSSKVVVAATGVPGATPPGEDNTSAPGGPRSLKQPGSSEPSLPNGVAHEAVDVVDANRMGDAKGTGRSNILFRSASISSSQRNGGTTTPDDLGPAHHLQFSSLRRTSSPARTGQDQNGLAHRHVVGGTSSAAGGKSVVSGLASSAGQQPPPTGSSSVNLSREDEPGSGVVSTTGSTSIHHFWQDPLQELARRTQAGSKRNALLRWCQSRVVGYPGIEVNNFSSSWNSGLALCALLHTYRPDKIPWSDLVTANGQPVDRRRCFEVAFSVAENDGVPTTLHLQDMLTVDRPEWSTVMAYVTSIYQRYETGGCGESTTATAATGLASTPATVTATVQS